MKKDELKIKQDLTCQEAVSLFTEIARSLSEGTLCLEYGDRSIVLNPGDRIESQIEAIRKQDRQELSIDLSWRHVDQDVPESPTLRVSSREPEGS